MPTFQVKVINGNTGIEFQFPLWYAVHLSTESEAAPSLKWLPYLCLLCANIVIIWY